MCQTRKSKSFSQQKETKLLRLDLLTTELSESLLNGIQCHWNNALNQGGMKTSMLERNMSKYAPQIKIRIKIKYGRMQKVSFHAGDKTFSLVSLNSYQ